MTRFPNPVLDAVLSGRSAPRLTDPAPGPADLERLVPAAATAPDHGRLRPWRLVAVTGDERARLGDVLAEAATSLPGPLPRRLISHDAWCPRPGWTDASG